MNFYDNYKKKFFSYPCLTAIEEKILWEKIEMGDEEENQALRKLRLN